jgi:hypothetical protein
MNQCGDKNLTSGHISYFIFHLLSSGGGFCQLPLQPLIPPGCPVDQALVFAMIGSLAIFGGPG